jgi:formylglycine-generating enzyme required for sulfatase activity
MATVIDGDSLSCLEAVGITFELCLIPEGSFKMGSGNKYFSEAPVHEVNIDRSFYLGKFPITQRQWGAVCGRNPSEFHLSEDHPVDSVSWIDSTRFCEQLSSLTGRRVRLPSEAEWEYACRAASGSEYFFTPEGPFLDDASTAAHIRRELLEFAWFDENSRGTTHPVGGKRSNGWGLCDMIGNVWEWCADHWHGSYDGVPSDGRPWLEANPRRPLRCLRGGAWDMNAFRCRSTYRSWDWEDLATNRFGLRICVETQ